MSYVGAYLGGAPAPAIVTVTPPVPVVVALPTPEDNLQFVDHVAQALSRLSQQFKAKNP